MSDWMRKQLEELMGQEALGYGTTISSFEDSKVCRDFLCGLCPYDLFLNTKSDIGTCPKQHSDQLKQDYEKAVKDGHATYEAEHLRSLERFVQDCDRKVQAAARRLEKIHQEDPKAAELMKAINDITETMATLMTDIVSMAQRGEVDEACKMMDEVERLNLEKEERDAELKAHGKAGGVSQQQKLRVCDVCSSYLSVYDTDQRLADHFAGKQHMGYVQIREKLEKLKEKMPAGGVRSRSREQRDYRGDYRGGRRDDYRGGRRRW